MEGSSGNFGGAGLLIVVLTIMLAGSFIILGVNGIKIDIGDSRLTRQEVLGALKERDQFMMGLAKAIEELQGKKKIAKDGK